ncbi:MAG: hypothetical protein B6D39_04015 [Anaerolineae bacterium UTCFX2]|jgi:nucleoside-diphosphate-sugar epimerase|nr:NAD(P)-dependent oxidoreductase [Anaerolineae bacterium]MCZ7551878.1 NAD(P)-dependent oxidoreductase [Anaerolineales bacterium]OQY92916.1 MAG: hypothetical protein B6D39_04015 [Anaerolineae bacterium UTCFX2]
MKIAVAGPTGVLGRALIPLLLEEGVEVRALARSVEKAQRLFPQRVEIVECDLLAPDIEKTLQPLLHGCETVMHIATAIPADASAPNAWVANTRLRTDAVRMLLDASAAAGVKRYFQQSITMAYPDCGDEWITEDMPLDTSSGRASVTSPVAAMETMVRESSARGLDWCILRGGSFVGKDTFQDRLIENLRAGKETVPCNGDNYVSLIHVADIAAAFVAALKYASAGSIFNIVDQPLRQREYVDGLAASIGAPKPPRDADSGCPPSWRCNNQHARSVLNWLPTHAIIPK